MSARDRINMANGQLEAWQMLYGDRFYCGGFPGLWQHCGWYSAVQHIAAFNLFTGEKRIIAHVCKVQLFEESFSNGAGI
ncbi:MAG: hypothetical protein Q7S10_02595 [bacterium]|nr:hypothetical protein [bacterium]